MYKKVLFSSFYYVFDRFRPCEHIRKHAFAGRNTQHSKLLFTSHDTFIIAFITITGSIYDTFYYNNVNRFEILEFLLEGCSLDRIKMAE